jgi:hypothetical protein
MRKGNYCSLARTIWLPMISLYRILILTLSLSFLNFLFSISSVSDVGRNHNFVMHDVIKKVILCQFSWNIPISIILLR